MVIKIGINGFGRIGRVIFRSCLEHEDLLVTAINDPAITTDYVCYLIKFDSTHGKFKGIVEVRDGKVVVNGSKINVYHHKHPSHIPWCEAKVEYVIEASGIFTTLEKAMGHKVNNCVKKVIVTAPSGDVPMVVIGVNDANFPCGAEVISCTSSTLYCLASIIRVLEDNFGVSEGFVTSIHAMTPSLKPLDGLCVRGKHWRDHRSIHQNIIPATTGCCKALGKIIPEVKDKLTGLAFRVPIVNVSVLDISIRLKQETSLKEIYTCIEKASITTLKDIISISRDEAVSSDFIGEKYSCVVDSDSSLQLNPNFFKLVCWYENEYSYACRVIDTVRFSESQNFKVQPTSPLVSVYSQQNSNSKLKGANVSPISNNSQVHKSSTVEVCLTPDNFSYHNKNDTDKKSLDVSISSNPDESNNKNNINSFFNHDMKGDEELSCATNQSENSQNRLQKVKKEVSKMITITEDLIKKSYKNFNASRVFTDVNKEVMITENSDNSNQISIVDFKSYSHSKVDNRRKNKHLNEKSKSNCLKVDDTINNMSEESKVKAKTQPNMLGESYINCEKQFNSEKLLPTVSASNNHFYTVSCNTNMLDKNGYTVIGKSQTNNKIKNKGHQDILPENNKCVNKSCNKEKNHQELLIWRQVVAERNHNRNNSNSLDAINILNSNTNENFNCESYTGTSRLVGNNKIVKIENSMMSRLLYNKCLNEITSEKLKKLSTYNLDMICSNHSEERTKCTYSESINEKTINVKRCNVTMPQEKQDIYDKLDSVSATDSENSFQINERKSQVIHLCDLSTSLEDLSKLDQICRIIEISDDLSDRLFSPLNRIHDGNISKWSLKDLCKKINLDDFCNNIFGNNV